MAMAAQLFPFLLCTTFVYVTSLEQETATCGYRSCPMTKDGYLNIHLVPHTHDDVGWLKTIDQYYYGNLMFVQDAGVQYILDTVVEALLHDHRRRFIYVESAFFWKWWLEQNEIVKHQVKCLVNRGQLEFVGGAWSMHDEACTHYLPMIDQSSLGFRRLFDTFGECGRPKVGWQIDPFGHSKTNAFLMSQFGFDGLFLGRIDWEDKNYRLKNLTAEMLWSTSRNIHGDSSILFTSLLFNTYSAPKGFCFDINCHDEPIVENRKSPMYNAEKRASEFVNTVKHYFDYYKTNNVLVTMGEDFLYMNAHMNFKNMDKLIYHINELCDEDLKVNAFYSTPSCYVKAVHDCDVIFPSKWDDFFPYSSDPMSFWTGFYTSRPTLKYFARLANNYLQVSKQLYSLGRLGDALEENLDEMREAVGVIQHHDAITGTEREHVACDYARILAHGFKECSAVTSEAINNLMKIGDVAVELESCLLLNISSCPMTEKCSRFAVTIYNPLSRPQTRLVKLPILYDEESSLMVLCPKGVVQSIQIIKIADFIKNIPGRESKADAHLYFLVSDIPPLGYLTYNVLKNPNPEKNNLSDTDQTLPTNIGFNEGTNIKINADGKVSHIVIEGKEICLNHEFYFYRGAVGNNEIHSNRSSGAYIFRPEGAALPVCKQPPKVTIFKGPLVHEIHQSYSTWVGQVIRIYKGAKHAEFQWVVGPIPVGDKVGKEVISRYSSSSIHNNGEFITDSNGKEYLLRKLNYRPTWPVELFEKIPGNYYPVTTTLSICEASSRLSILTDRSQGGSSLCDGQMELMVHRRLLHDDAFGVGEALNEIAFGEGLVATGTHWVTTVNISSVRLLVQERIFEPWIFFSEADGLSFDDWKLHFKTLYSGLKKPLEKNVHILTLEPWNNCTYLLRLEHIMDKEDDPQLSKSVEIDLKTLFSELEIKDVEEMTLGANMKITELKKLKWLVNKTHVEPKAKVARDAQPGNQTSTKVTGDAQHGNQTSTKVTGDAQHRNQTSTKGTGDAQHNNQTSTKETGDAQQGNQTSTKVTGDAQHSNQTSTKVTGDAQHGNQTSAKETGDAQHGNQTSAKETGDAQHDSKTITKETGDAQHDNKTSTKVTGDAQHGNQTSKLKCPFKIILNPMEIRTFIVHF